MGSLSNLYISQSYQSLLHFGNDSSASTTLVELQDGVGNGLGVSLNTLGDLDVERQLIVHNGAEITGAVDINTNFSGSTQGFINQSSVNNLIRITGSYTPTGNQASITEIGIGWLVNGGAVSNGRVINVTGTPNSDVTYTIDQFYTANGVAYTFTGSIQRAVDITGDLDVSDDLFVGGHLTIEDGVEITGSIDITGDVTASNAFVENDLNVGGTLFASKVVTLIESSSIIFSSGSNILGDSTSDTQTLIGDVIMSGSSQLTGSMTVSNNISSSTISGIGNVTIYSASVDQRLSSLQVASASLQNFSASVISSLSSIYQTTASLNQTTASLNQFTASLVITFVTTASLQATASFLQNQIDQKLFTSSFNSYTSSTNIRLNNLETTTASLNSAVSQLNASSASQQVSINALNALSGTLATTGSNTFRGQQIVTGSLRGNVTTLSVVSSTASMDFSTSNMFVLTLVGGTNTRLVASNISNGQTINLQVIQPSTTGSISYPSYFKFPAGNLYSASFLAGAVDIVSFITMEDGNVYGVNVKNMI